MHGRAIWPPWATASVFRLVVRRRGLRRAHGGMRGIRLAGQALRQRRADCSGNGRFGHGGRCARLQDGAGVGVAPELMDDPLVRVKTGKMGNRGQCGQWNLLAIILCVAFAYDSKRLNQHDQAASDEKRDHEDRTGDREDIASKPGRDIGNLAPQAKVFKRDRGGRDARLGGLPAEFFDHQEEDEHHAADRRWQENRHEHVEKPIAGGQQDMGGAISPGAIGKPHRIRRGDAHLCVVEVKIHQIAGVIRLALQVEHRRQEDGEWNGHQAKPAFPELSAFLSVVSFCMSWDGLECVYVPEGRGGCGKRNAA